MATAVLLIWPFIAMGLFAGLGPARGLIWSCIIGYLFLPEYEAFDLPALPAYGKYTVISLGLILGVLISGNKGGPKPETTDRTIRLIMIALMSGIFLGLAGTIMNNTDAVVRAGRFQQGHSIRDLISLGSELLIMLTPFFLARRWLADPKEQAHLLFAFVALALVYSVLVLFEARMSPQLNRWVYDFFPHSWRQHIRGGGFRPIVFLGHGLSVGFFLFIATLSAFAMVRHTKGQARMLYAMAGVWILLVLILSRNLGATMLAFMFVPLLLVFGRRPLIWVATGCAFIFMLYPVARVSLPSEQFVNVIATISEARAQSFSFRLKHEGKLVERAMEKPVFGWGGWGRARVVDERGRDSSVTDGTWIIQLGKYGWVGYIALFGLIAIPIYCMKRRKTIPYVSIGLGLILAGNLLYSIPNAELNPLSWLMVGTLAGYLQFGRKGASTPDTEMVPASGTTDGLQLVYSRFPARDRNVRASRPYRRSH